MTFTVADVCSALMLTIVLGAVGKRLGRPQPAPAPPPAEEAADPVRAWLNECGCWTCQERYGIRD